MKREIDTIFGLARQNNSGGYLIENDDVDVYVAIEAIDEESLCDKYNRIVQKYSIYCQCCGTRWDGVDMTDWHEKPFAIDNFKEVEYEHNCILYMIDGTKKKVRFTQND